MSQRISDYRLREAVEDLNLSAGELAELLELTATDIIRKFPHKVRANMDKFGINDYIATGEEDEDVQSISTEEG